VEITLHLAIIYIHLCDIIGSSAICIFLWCVFVVLKVTPEGICAYLPTPAIPGWQHLIPHLSSDWLPGNADIEYTSKANCY